MKHNPTSPDAVGAFNFICGYIVSANENKQPVDAKTLIQSVYEEYGVLPANSLILKLGIKL